MKHLFVLLLLTSASVLYSVPENYEARIAMREIITAPTSDVLEADTRVLEQLSDGARVNYMVKVQNDSFYQLFINENEGRFPLYGEGSYIIKRSLEDGRFIQIKVFLKNHTECFVRLYPLDDRAMMEVVLYGRAVYKGINLPYSFSDVLVEPFSEIMEASAGIVDWALILPEPGEYIYNDKMALSSAVRRALPHLRDADDGALDADGSYVFIEDLSPQPENPGGFNCSGFVKWVADAFYWRAAGEYMSVADLKTKHPDLRGHRWSSRHEDDRDPYFGLDWTRNIAAAVAAAEGRGSTAYEAVDVRNIPWSDYTDDIGYPVTDLKLIMYYLAVNEPRNIYLASVNVPWGTGPVLQQHVHTAVLVPYIDRNGGFNDVVFERNFESTAELLAERYPGAHIHLVRIATAPGFRLPETDSRPVIGPEGLFRR